MDIKMEKAKKRICKNCKKEVGEKFVYYKKRAFGCCTPDNLFYFCNKKCRSEWFEKKRK
jgi:hypothetical protein